VADDDGWQMTASFLKFLLIFFNLGQVCRSKSVGLVATKPMRIGVWHVLMGNSSPILQAHNVMLLTLLIDNNCQPIVSNF